MGVGGSSVRKGGDVPYWNEHSIRLGRVRTSVYKGACMTNQPIKQPINQSTKQSTKQPTNQTTKQPSNQSTNQPINQPHAHPHARHITEKEAVSSKVHTVDILHAYSIRGKRERDTHKQAEVFVTSIIDPPLGGSMRVA